MNRVTSFFRIGDDNPLTGWHVLGIVGLFFGTIIAVNIVMAIFATGTFPGLVVHNSYVASQNYNDLIAESRALEARGWTADVAAADGYLRAALTAPGGAPLTGLRVLARVGRPASDSEDRELAFVPDGDAYVATETLRPGRWIVELEAWSGEALSYRATHPLTVAGEGA